MEVTIFIETSLKNPKRGTGMYGYVIEYLQNGTPVTREGFGRMEDATESALTLAALAEALRRLKTPCIVNIVSGCRILAAGLDNGWIRKWQEAGWKTSRGKEVKNRDSWRKIYEAAAIHALRISDAGNTYGAWLRGRMNEHDAS